METKYCGGKWGCQQDLPIENFRLNYNKKEDIYIPRTYCKKCDLKRNQKWDDEHPDKQPHYHQKSYRAYPEKYGVTGKPKGRPKGSKNKPKVVVESISNN